MQNNWGEELNKDRTETIPEEKQTASVWIVNIFFMFIVLFVPFLIAEAIGTVFGWIVPPDSLTHTKDMSRNFYVVVIEIDTHRNLVFLVVYVSFERTIALGISRETC